MLALGINCFLTGEPPGVCGANSATFRILIRQPQGVS